MRPNRRPQKWVADLSYIDTDEGWLYLATVMDLFSRRIVGWAMSDHMETPLVEEALRMALIRRRPSASLLHHSDRGSQYASKDYRALLAAWGITVSMSRTGDCYDNAVMESFFGTLKTECATERYASRAQARTDIFEYIEVWYNRQRRHSTLGYLSPHAFEAAYALDGSGDKLTDGSTKDRVFQKAAQSQLEKPYDCHHHNTSLSKMWKHKHGSKRTRLQRRTKVSLQSL
jgi:transposase InsO family protein